ncbi:MAG: DinB family protein [Acidimicrobiales bacterium]
MTEFVDQDLSGSTFRRTTLSGSTMHEVRFEDGDCRRMRLNRTEFRGVMMHGTKLLGAELCDVVINGDLQNVVINGVEISAYVEAELNRRSPERALMKPTDPAGFRTAWDVLEQKWGETVERARALPPDAVHRSVDGEWSFVQTLRHLSFASSAWVGRMIHGDPSPWHPLELPWDEAPDWDDIPCDRASRPGRDARPSLDEVLELRRARQAMVRDVIEHLTADQLASTVTRLEPGWPQEEDFSFAECLLIVLNEEYEHRRFAERDLDQL